MIENRPGGNDSIGPDVVAKAAPDGYTIGVISSSLSINQTSAGIKLPFDPVRVGMCEQEPIVQVIFCEQAKVTYGKVNPEVASQIMKQHVQHGMPLKDHVLPL